jgi:imidazole glycerol-phosphate synthase subunit HisF
VEAASHCLGRSAGEGGGRLSMVRLIARLDIKGPNLIKGVHLEGLRIVGDPQEYARLYYEAGVDEIIYMDTVASLYGRNNLTDIVRRAAHHVFVPLTVGGGVRSIDDVRSLLCVGADKVAINTAATKRPELITEVAKCFGSQCMVLSIEAKRIRPGSWEVYTDNGRERSGKDVCQWAVEGVERGAGEILLTSVDQEGSMKGFDIDLIRTVSDKVSVPIIASGGMGNANDFVKAVQQGKADAVAMAHVLHYRKCTIDDIRKTAAAANIAVRFA